MLENIKNLENVQLLSKAEQKSVNGGTEELAPNKWCTTDRDCATGEVCGSHYSGGRICRKIRTTTIN